MNDDQFKDIINFGHARINGRSYAAKEKFFAEGRAGKAVIYATLEGNFLSPKAVEQALSKVKKQTMQDMQNRPPFHVDKKLKKAALKAAEAFRAEEEAQRELPPMGCSEWAEYGKKYQYWEYFEGQVIRKCIESLPNTFGNNNEFYLDGYEDAITDAIKTLQQLLPDNSVKYCTCGPLSEEKKKEVEKAFDLKHVEKEISDNQKEDGR